MLKELIFNFYNRGLEEEVLELILLYLNTMIEIEKLSIEHYHDIIAIETINDNIYNNKEIDVRCKILKNDILNNVIAVIPIQSSENEKKEEEKIDINNLILRKPRR